MSHLGKALLTSLMAMALIGVASTPTAAARMSKEEKSR
jgi:hypothetical protein